MSAKFILNALELSHDDSWDVIVVGGGPSGCAAATASARRGAKTLLIESTATLGGMGTSGLVTVWTPFDDFAGTIIYGGIAWELFQQTRAYLPDVDQNDTFWVHFDPEHLKRLYDKLVCDAGVHVLFNTSLAAVETGDDGVRAVIISNKAGLSAHSAKVYIDSTGDGDLCAWAGAEFEKGDSETGELQPASLCFMLGNVNDSAYQSGINISSGNPESPIYEALRSNKFPELKDPHCIPRRVWPGILEFNAGHIWDVDNTDPVSVSKAVMEGRKIALSFRDALAECYPEAFGQAKLIATAPLLGIRETRRIIGDYVLNVDDYLARRKFADEIGRNNYWIDIHTSKNEIEKARHGTSHVGKRYEHYKPGETHGIPYRSLIPQRLNNVLVAGRCISCDRPVQGAIRVMNVCVVTGEAAGAAASLAARDSGDVRAVNARELRSELQNAGAYLPEI